MSLGAKTVSYLAFPSIVLPSVNVESALDYTVSHVLLSVKSRVAVYLGEANDPTNMSCAVTASTVLRQCPTCDVLRDSEASGVTLKRSEMSVKTTTSMQLRCLYSIHAMRWTRPP